MGLAEDLTCIVEQLTSRLDHGARGKLKQMGEQLLELAIRRAVSSNHAVMELVVAYHLILKGFDVEVEHEVDQGLTCDVYARAGDRSVIVEVETGFVPPENALDPATFRMAREVSKVARYSKYADEFALAVPPFHILQLPLLLLLPPKARSAWDALRLKGLLDAYYKRPPVELDDILSARVNYVYLIMVEELRVIELAAEEYFKTFIEHPLARLGLRGALYQRLTD